MDHQLLFIKYIVIFIRGQRARERNQAKPSERLKRSSQSVRSIVFQIK